MRIALAAEGTRGDIYPMFALGASLIAHGHEIVVCAPPDFRSEAEERGMRFEPVGISVREYLTEKAHALTLGGRAMLREGRSYAETSLRAQFQRLPEATADADAVVAAGVQLAAGSAAELRGIPYRYVVYCPSMLPSAEHPSALLSLGSLPRWANRLSWRILLALQERWLGGALNRERDALGLAPVRNVFRHLLTQRPVLAADHELAPSPRDCPFDVEQVPCLHPLQGAPLPPKLEAFLEQGPPPVYVGFGSMTDPDPGATTRALLEALSQIGCRALISRGWAGLADGPLPEDVLAIGPVSHAELFPRLAAVVHHGGAGTTTTAARAGVPQIVVPHIFDQFYWARRVAELGLGPPAPRRRRLAAQPLAESLAATLDNEVLLERARELGERLRSRAAADVAPPFGFDDLDGADG
jgi:UDP:flavonoid glycosyltransferase YjiC (YdhE family)